MKYEVSRAQLDYRNRQPYEDREKKIDVLEQAILNYQKEGWILLSRTTNTAQLTKPKGNANCALVAILLLLGILPGIIYLLLHAVTREKSVLLVVDRQTGIVQETFR